MLIFAPVLVLLVAWAADDGGYDPTTWYPGALLLLALAGALVVAAPGLAWRRDRALLVAQSLFFGYTAWTYASISWAAVRGDAWDGANRTLLYLLVFVTFSTWRWSIVSALGFLAAWAGAIVFVCGFSLVRASASTQPATFFPFGRFSEPFGYANANAAALVLAFWPLVACVQVRSLPRLVRALALALAAVGIQLALLAQSRGSMLAFPVALIVYLVVARQRLRAAIAVALALAPAFILRHVLLNVYTAADLSAAVDDAARAVGLTAATLAAVGLVAVIADDRLVLTPRRARIIARVAVAGAAAAVAIGFVTFGELYGNPATAASRSWHNFKHPAGTAATSSRFSSTGGNSRYDFWRVALRGLRDHPLRGVGVDNFAAQYARERQTLEQPLYPHSFVIRLFSQTGLVGAGLMLGALGAAIVAAAPVLRSSAGRIVGAAAGALVAAYLVHGAFDWFWEVPALTAPAFAALGLLAALARPAAQQARRRVCSPALRAVLVLPLVAAATGSLIPPWLAARDVQFAASVWQRDPARADGALRQASRLNPLSERADLVAGAIAARRREWRSMEQSFDRAVGRNRVSWYAWFRLGVARAMQNDRPRALEALQRARVLNPLEPAIAETMRVVGRGDSVDPMTLDRAFVEPVIAASGRLS